MNYPCAIERCGATRSIRAKQRWREGKLGEWERDISSIPVTPILTLGCCNKLHFFMLEWNILVVRVQTHGWSQRITTFVISATLGYAFLRSYFAFFVALAASLESPNWKKTPYPLIMQNIERHNCMIGDFRDKTDLTSVVRHPWIMLWQQDRQRHPMFHFMNVTLSPFSSSVQSVPWSILHVSSYNYSWNCMKISKT